MVDFEIIFWIGVDLALAAFIWWCVRPRKVRLYDEHADDFNKDLGEYND